MNIDALAEKYDWQGFETYLYIFGALGTFSRLGETPKRIHSLEQLHADLPDWTFARKIETEFESVTGTPLASFLSQHKNDFIELRYFFGQTKQFSFSDVRNLGHILAVQYQAG
jgi:hypothetical protein